MFRFLRQPFVLAMTLLIAGQAALFYAYPRSEIIPQYQPLKEVSQAIGPWRMVREIPMETEVQELLRADDSLNRYYLDAASAGGESVSIFIALFRTQRSGVTPHSPKVCLPGSGWTPSESERISIKLAGRPEEATINRYVVSKGEQRNLVLYWYQSSARITASEYTAKVFTVLDGVRYRRSDTSLVRVIVPFNGDGEDEAQKLALRFLNDTYMEFNRFLPNQ
jgi:EpsI family protein